MLCSPAVRHDSFKASRDELDNRPPWILDIQSVVLIHWNRVSNLLCPSLHSLLAERVHIRHCDPNVEQTTTFVILREIGLCFGGDFGLLKLKEFDANAIAGRETPRGDLL